LVALEPEQDVDPSERGSGDARSANRSTSPSTVSASPSQNSDRRCRARRAGARDELRDAVRVRDVAHAVARGVPHEDLHPDVGQDRCEVLGLSACNHHLMELAARTREGIGDAGAIALEFPVHPLQQTG